MIVDNHPPDHKPWKTQTSKRMKEEAIPELMEI
jgi:hypothetical protein